jgi:hypothetical protein
MTTDSVGSIAAFIVESFNNIPIGVSGNMTEIVDLARQHVANYVGASINPNSIETKYQPAITNLAKADVIDFVNAQAGGENLSLAELSISETGEQMSAEQWRLLGEKQLSVLGRKFNFARSLS